MKLGSYRLDYGNAHIIVKTDYGEAAESFEVLVRHYSLLVDYINRHPLFGSTYEPVDVEDDAPDIIKLMDAASRCCGVGPMACVAGTFAQIIGEHLVDAGAKEVLVENGGDIYLNSCCETTVGIHAGPSPLSDIFALKVTANENPCGICTSSDSVGHSISMGTADSVTVVAESSVLADAAATCLGNELKDDDDAIKVFDIAGKLKGVRGVVTIKNETFSAYGRLPEILMEKS